MWLVIWMCLRVAVPADLPAWQRSCRIWNLEIAAVTMRGCTEFANMYLTAWDDPFWRVQHWRCSTTPVPKGQWDAIQVED